MHHLRVSDIDLPCGFEARHTDGTILRLTRRVSFFLREDEGVGRCGGRRVAQFTLAAGRSRSRYRRQEFILTWWSGLAAGGLFNDCSIEHLRLISAEIST
jgi:hypothetical protein